MVSPLAPLAAALALLAAPPPPAASRDPAAERFTAALAALDRDHGPRAVVALRELSQAVDDTGDRPRAILALARAAEDVAADPTIRALARQRLSAQELARGNLSKAAAHLARLGLVERWLVVGPFDDEGKKGLDAVYPPELGLDLAAPLTGKVRQVSWRAAPPEAVTHGFVHLGAILRPATEVAAYALAVVDAPGALPARLWFGGSGRAKVWVNGALAITDGGDHPARLDQRGAQVALRPGPNRILVKLCNAGGAMAFALRLADERGEALPVTARDGATLLAAGLPEAPAPGDRSRPLPSLVERLEARAAAAALRPGPAGRVEEAGAREALAVALREQESADGQERRAGREARRAAELAPGEVRLQLLAASLEEERNARLERLAAAQAAAPEDPRVLLALAEERLALDRPQEAARLLQRVVALAPGWLDGLVALAAAHDRAGLSARATADRLALGDRVPLTFEAAVAASGAARRLGRLDRAASLLRAALALKFDDPGARASLSRLLLTRGDLDGALALEAEALRLAPANVAQRLRLADLLAANGRLEASEAAFADVIRICPEEAEAWERRGRARLRAGRRADALADLQRSLELKPQEPAVKELVRSLEPERERYEVPYLLDGATLARGPDGAGPADDAVVLGELEVIRLQASGLSSRFQQRVVKVLTQRGADAARQQSVAYDPGRQAVKVERGRIFKAGGQVIEAWNEADRSASEPWYRLYYDTRTRTLTLPALAPGDVLEVAWRLEDTAAENLLSDYFGDLTFVEGSEPRRRFDYVILAPEGRALHANAPAGVTRTTRALGGGPVEHRWQAQDLPRIEPEPRMPGWAEVARFLHVSTYASWDEVNGFYWGLVKDQLRPTPELTELARRLADEALAARGLDARPGRGGALEGEALRAVVAAIYGFVVTQTRYVGLEFGIHGFKPYRVDQVLSRRFGDCKDKASLALAMLQAVGIDSRLVLLRMRRLGRMPAEPASLAVFNHAILHVPALDLWLDGTASYTGTGELPAEDRGATVLVVEPGGPPRFTRIPEASLEQNRTESRFEISLGADGAARVAGRSLIAGTQASSYRRAYQTEHDRRATLEEALNRTFPGLAVEQVTVSDLARLEEDVTMAFSLRVPRWAEVYGGTLRFTPFGAGAGYTESWATLSSRKQDLVLGQPSVNRFEYRVALPPGWEARALPEPVTGETPQAAFQVRWRIDGAAVVAEGFVAFRSAVVPAADYPAFRELMNRIDRAFGRQVVAAPRAAAEAR
jgi:tetratricopeptide (TPR) repeat protein